jgi:hypothetical protein
VFSRKQTLMRRRSSVHLLVDDGQVGSCGLE